MTEYFFIKVLDLKPATDNFQKVFVKQTAASKRFTLLRTMGW